MTGTSAFASADELIVSVPISAEQIGSATTIGATNIAKAGQIQLIAERAGTRVFVKAVGPGNSVLGRAESVVGLKETPLYISTASGLQKIIVLWGE